MLTILIVFGLAFLAFFIPLAVLGLKERRKAQAEARLEDAKWAPPRRQFPPGATPNQPQCPDSPGRDTPNDPAT